MKNATRNAATIHGEILHVRGGKTHENATQIAQNESAREHAIIVLEKVSVRLLNIY